MENGSWCLSHRPDNRSPSSTATATRRHKRLRERLVRQGPPWVCGICGQLIHSASDMQAHHVVAVANGGAVKAEVVPTHALCNARLGARTG